MDGAVNGRGAATIDRVVLRNFKSIGACDVALGPLTFLTGRNGAGKSNFLDALHFVRDALADSLEVALKVRFGVGEVLRRAGRSTAHFAISIESTLADGRRARYAFSIGATQNGGHEVLREQCEIDSVAQAGPAAHFSVLRGAARSSEPVFPAVTADRLGLVAASGLAAFRPVFDALASMKFFNLHPHAMRDPPARQDGRVLLPSGENIASVLAAMRRDAPEDHRMIVEYLGKVVPALEGLDTGADGPVPTIGFRQGGVEAGGPWTFHTQNMSDGTLRALGILTALFHRGTGPCPTLVGIEEPETALHPAASGILRAALASASERSQIVVTSHSPELLDDPAIDPASIRLATMIDGDTRVTPLAPRSEAAIAERLFTAGELLALDQLEAPAEALICADPRTRQSDLFAPEPS